MSVGTMKIAISLPRQAFDEVEDLRHELGLARSQAILEAIHCWLKKRHEQVLEDAYAKGYKKKPEDAGTAGPLFLAGLSSFSKESW
jgi:metal-responsive CopG/Arc/MetJ family transcriptional regulator